MTRRLATRAASIFVTNGGGGVVLTPADEHHEVVGGEPPESGTSHDARVGYTRAHVTELHPFRLGDLTIEPTRSEDGKRIDCFWRGRSNDRQPARTVLPWVVEILATAAREKVAVTLHFEPVEHMNSSTITAIIQIIQEARATSTPLALHFDPKKTWQRLSFEALGVFVKGDGLLQLVAESAS